MLLFSLWDMFMLLFLKESVTGRVVGLFHFETLFLFPHLSCLWNSVFELAYLLFHLVCSLLTLSAARISRTFLLQHVWFCWSLPWGAPHPAHTCTSSSEPGFLFCLRCGGVQNGKAGEGRKGSQPSSPLLIKGTYFSAKPDGY